MSRGLATFLFAQFLTAFGDNAILFAAVALVLQQGQSGGWYLPALQSAFLLAFVVLAPWVGVYADRHPKAGVLVRANLIKGAGTLLLIFGADPLLAFLVVGAGAAYYGPAKYGILPELVSEDRLVRVNGWVEGSTILAIVGGSMIGAAVADHSVQGAFLLVLALYFLSALAARFVPKTAPQRAVAAGFPSAMRGLLATSRARFSTLGVSLFWAAATVLRVAVVAWAPLVLGLTKSVDLAELILFSAIGTVLGAALASRWIPLQCLRRARLAAYGMGLAILLLSAVWGLWEARALLLVAGLMGGLFVVPVNAALQHIGHRSIGAGSAVAVQHFFENLAMVAATGLYSLAAGQGADPVASLLGLGVAVVLATVLVSWNLPPDPAAAARSPNPAPGVAADESRPDRSSIPVRSFERTD